MALKTAIAAPPPGGKKSAPAEERRPTTEERFADFSARYKWFFFAPLLIAIAAVVVLAVVSGQHRNRRAASIEAYRAARRVEDFDAVAARYRGTFDGARSLVRAGDLLYSQGRYAEARERYEAYLATGPDPALGIPVRTAIVQTYIAQKDYAGAVAACKAILAAGGREYAQMQAMYYRGYALELSGDLKGAADEYGKVLDAQKQGGSSRWVGLAREHSREVARKLKSESENAKKDVDTPEAH
jgi:tetratricopeptide (TPR) repeat protein